MLLLVLAIILQQVTAPVAVIALECLHRNTTCSMQSMLGRTCTLLYSNYLLYESYTKYKNRKKKKERQTDRQTDYM